MTIKEAQELVDAWGDKHAIRHNELANMALLTEEIGKLARVMVRRYGEHAADPRFRGEATDEIGDILWALIGVANQTGVDLTAALIRRKGNKLYVDGRLTLTAESAALLPQLEYCKVTGTALVPAAQEKAFSASCVQAEKVQTVRGRLLQGQGRVQVDYWMLEAPDGLCVKECGMVALTPELEPELIVAKLMLLECGMVQCTAAQKGAVQLVAKDVGVISDDSGKPTEDTNTHKVRADRYVM